MKGNWERVLVIIWFTVLLHKVVFVSLSKNVKGFLGCDGLGEAGLGRG